MKRTTKTFKTVATVIALAMLMSALALTLSGCGNKTVMTFEADNGKTGLEAAAADKIDLFFVDVNMPVMDGLECVSLLKKDSKYSNTPIVFLTTVTDTEKKQMGQNLGVNGWIQKPFNPDQLRKLTKMLLGI